MSTTTAISRGTIGNLGKGLYLRELFVCAASLLKSISARYALQLRPKFFSTRG